MSKIEARGAEAADRADWKQAWSVVAQLAAARSASLREYDQDAGAAHPLVGADPEPAPFDGRGIADPRRAHAELVSSIFGAEATTRAAAPFAPIAPDQLARDMAAIEKAAAALRRAEPGLEPQTTPPAAAELPVAHTSHSVWVLVAVIWLTAAAVVSCAIGTAALLLN